MELMKFTNYCREKTMSRLLFTSFILLSVILLAFFNDHATARAEYENSGREWRLKDKKPIIGVLTQVVRDYRRFSNNKLLHIASSYVKWIESAGARVIPILVNQNDSYYEKIFPLTNGLLFPGGDNLLDPKKDTPMMVAAKKLYKMAVESNDRGNHYPIWGTCLGMELLSVLTSGKNALTLCNANDVRLPMKFVARGRLFSPESTYSNLIPDFSGTIMDALSKENLTYNFHHFCLTDTGLAKANLTGIYRPLAYSEDLNGLKFITVFEAIKYPFYGVQFHPEKPPFEFVVSKSQRQVSHSREAIAVSRYFADYFVESAIKNNQHASVDELQDYLVYSCNATYTAPLGDIYEQRYLFLFNGSRLNTEEFLDYIPDDQDDVSEFVDVSSRDKAAEIRAIQSGRA